MSFPSPKPSMPPVNEATVRLEAPSCFERAFNKVSGFPESPNPPTQTVTLTSEGILERASWADERTLLLLLERRRNRRESFSVPCWMNEMNKIMIEIEWDSACKRLLERMRITKSRSMSKSINRWRAWLTDMISMSDAIYQKWVIKVFPI